MSSLRQKQRTVIIYILCCNDFQIQSCLCDLKAFIVEQEFIIGNLRWTPELKVSLRLTSPNGSIWWPMMFITFNQAITKINLKECGATWWPKLYLVCVLLQWFSKQSKHFSVTSASNLEKYWKKSAFQVYRQGRVRGGIRSGSIRDGGGGSTWPVALPPPTSARAPPVSWQQAGRSTLEEVEDWHWSCKIKTTLFPSISSWEGKVLWLDLVKTL